MENQPELHKADLRQSYAGAGFRLRQHRLREHRCIIANFRNQLYATPAWNPST